MCVPIEGEAGLGYVMRPGYDLPPLMFDLDEQEAVAVGLALVARTGDAALLRGAFRAAAKNAAAVPDERRSDVGFEYPRVSTHGAPAPRALTSAGRGPPSARSAR